MLQKLKKTNNAVKISILYISIYYIYIVDKIIGIFIKTTTREHEIMRVRDVMSYKQN